ncbi:HEAT repeat domain-containing protein [Methylomagnum ishizawai]|uniref:HEAT repeat domain-containing protein n=1 Tax=Methylomagnum ishizawai TaxID=1760988 RepID=UPI001C342DDA|nr:HEAT repeat domain-containing protein [Methylomagnum ishizawai]BBL75368.1 protein YibA [Methylomagnum ishizawai]
MKKTINSDSRSTKELIESAYIIQDEGEYWHIIATLHERGSKTEFDAAKKLTDDPDPINREIGADMLGQLGWSKRTFHKKSVAILKKLLSDSEPDVIASAAFALGHRNDPSAIPELLKLTGHPNPWVRHGVAFGLSCHDDNSAVNGLILLSQDAEFDVRNWATFGLGSQCDIDNDQLRKALIERTNDPEPEIRGEALIGLAKRKDERVIDKIAQELTGEFFGIWAVEAVSLFPSQQFEPLLVDLLNSLFDENKKAFSDEIVKAITNCKNAN